MNQKLTFDELVRRSARDAEMSESDARAALTGALGLLHKHGRMTERNALYAGVAGAKAAAQSPEAKPKAAKGLFSGILKSAGGVSGAVVADGMGLLNRMSKLGVPRSSLRRLLPVARGHVQVETGSDLLGAALRTVPGVATMLGDG